MPTATTSQRGVLFDAPPEGVFELLRAEPAPALARTVERYWRVRWELTRPFVQETLPHPTVNAVFEQARAEVHGVGTRRFTITLVGSGQVVGIKWRPGCFLPWYGKPLTTLRDASLPVTALWGEAASGLWSALMAEPDFTGQTALLDAFLGPRVPAPDAQAERIAALIGEIAFERGLTRAATLAERTGQNLRALQRSFERYVGVGPKWVIRRLRIHDAAEQLKRGEELDFARLAQELGYVDQAHFIRDFSAQLGRTPTAYLAEQRARRADSTSSP